MTLVSTLSSLVANGVGLSTPAEDIKVLKSGKTELENKASEIVSSCIAAKDLDKLSALLDYAFDCGINKKDDGSSTLAFDLQLEAIRELPLDLVHQFWSYLETRRERWTPQITGQKTVVLLRTLKGLIDRLHPRLHVSLIKDILLYLAMVTGPGHSSRLNKRGKSNTYNFIDVDTSSTSTSPEYNTFWQLQYDLADPNGLMSSEALTKFLDRSQDVTQRFAIACSELAEEELEVEDPVFDTSDDESASEDDDNWLEETKEVEKKQGRSKENRPSALESTWMASATSLGTIWNTDPDYFETLESTVGMWCILSLQMIFVLDYIQLASPESKKNFTDKVSSGLPPYTLSAEEADRTNELRKEWKIILRKSTGSSEDFCSLYDAATSIERPWVDWKLEGCPPWVPNPDSHPPVSMSSDEIMKALDVAAPKKLPSIMFCTNEIEEALRSDTSVEAFVKPLPAADSEEVMGKMQTDSEQDAAWIKLRLTREFKSWKSLLNILAEQKPPCLPDIPILPPREPAVKNGTGKRGLDDVPAPAAKRARTEDHSSSETQDRYAAATIRPDAGPSPRPSAVGRGRNLVPY